MHQAIRAYVRVVDRVNRFVGRCAMYLIFVMLGVLLYSSLSKAVFTPAIWTLAAWCETRGDFRVFRVDRILAVQDTGEAFADEPGRDLAAYRARLAAEITLWPETRNSDPAGS